MTSRGAGIPSARLLRWPGYLVLLTTIALAGAAEATDYLVKEVPIPTDLLQRESVRFVALDLVAKRKIEADGETGFLRGKVLNLDFFVGTLLPQAVALSKTVQSGDTSCLDETLFT